MAAEFAWPFENNIQVANTYCLNHDFRDWRMAGMKEAVLRNPGNLQIRRIPVQTGVNVIRTDHRLSRAIGNEVEMRMCISGKQEERMTHVYQFKVALDHNKRIYRCIEITEDQTLADLHEAVFSAFNRFEEHLYSFYMTGKKTASRQRMYASPEYSVMPDPEDKMPIFGNGQKGDAEATRIGGLRLKEKSVFYYIFDYGDSWWHEITLLAIREVDSSTGYPKVVKKVGESPAQYPDEDEEEW